MRARAGVRYGCFAGAGAIVVWSLLVPGSGAEAPAAVPAGAVFASVASATGVLQHTDARMGLSATSEPVYGSLPDVSSTFSSGSGYARSSTYYPGATVLGLGGLISTAGGPSGIPGYPFTAIADDQHPDGSIPSPAAIGGAGQPASAESATATAHVSAAGTTADAVISSFNAPGSAARAGSAPTDSVVHVGSVQTHSRQSFDASGKLVSHADSLVSDITIAGGLHIGSVSTTSTTSVGTDGKRHRDEQVTVTGGTFQGNAVSVGANGVTVAGSGQGKAALDLANATLAQALGAKGVRIHLVGVNHPPAALNPRGCTEGEADGLEISAQVDASGVPVAGNVYYTDILLGAACTAATYGTSSAGDLSAPATGGDTGAGTVASTPDAPASPTPAAPAVALPAPALSSQGPAGSIPAAPKPARAGRSAPARGLSADLTSATVARRLRALYLAIGLVALGLVLGAKSLVPSRPPGTP